VKRESDPSHANESETYESMLLREDLAEERPIHCLACQKEVGRISFLGQHSEPRAEVAQADGREYRLVSLSVNTDLVTGVVGSRTYIRFACECGKTSIYHLVL